MWCLGIFGCFVWVCDAAFSPGWVGGYLVFLWDCEFWICLFVSALIAVLWMGFGCLVCSGFVGGAWCSFSCRWFGGGGFGCCVGILCLVLFECCGVF